MGTAGRTPCNLESGSNENLSAHNVKEQVHESSALASKTLDGDVGSTAALCDGLLSEVAADNLLTKEKTPILLNVENDSEGEAKTLKGGKVRKKFGKIYIPGKVIDFDPQRMLSKILYENGVEEELEVQELKPLLVSAESLSASKEVGIVSVERYMDLRKAKKARVPNMNAKKGKATVTKTISRFPNIPKSHGKRRKLSTVMTKSQVVSNRQAKSKLRDLDSLMSLAMPEARQKTKANLTTLNQKSIQTKVLDSESSTPKSTDKVGRNEKSATSVSDSEVAKSPSHLAKLNMQGKMQTRQRTVDVNQPGPGRGIDVLGTTSQCSHVGKRVRKLRDGVVVKFDKKANSYKVKYDDGNQENLQVDELEQMLVPEMSSVDMESDDRPSKLSSLSLLLSRDVVYP